MNHKKERCKPFLAVYMVVFTLPIISKTAVSLYVICKKKKICCGKLLQKILVQYPMKAVYKRKLEYKSIMNKCLGLLQDDSAYVKRCIKNQRMSSVKLVGGYLSPRK